MDVVVVGGHGKVGLRLLRLLAGRGDSARGVIRNPDHATDLERAGAKPVVCDIEADEADLAGAVGDADAVVFAAGAGPGSGPERKHTVDHAGAVKLIEAAKANGVERYVMVSSMGADNPPGGDEVFAVYLRAKAAADEAIEASGLDHTIVRPGSLTDDPGTGRIEASASLGRRGKVPRDDVAATLLAVLDERSTVGKTFEVLGGEQEIAAALRNL
jgi:uncharacterized protein YbjT (DUF2867 family)